MILYLIIVPKLKVVKPIISAKRIEATNENNIKGRLKIILKKPTNLVLKSRYKVTRKRKVDSKAVKRMMIFLLSHKKGLNRQVKITPGALRAIPLKEASKFPSSKPALLVSSSLWIA